MSPRKSFAFRHLNRSSNSMQRNLSLAVLITIFLSGVILAQSKVQKIDALLKQYNEYGQFNGATLVAERGKVIYKKGFGFANFEWKIPVAPDTKFRIGSVTKSFTAILILQLVEQGKLKLDDKIGLFLTDFSKLPFEQITVNHLLVHTSGLPDYNNAPNFFREVQSGLLSEAEIIKRISQYDLLFEPGAKFSYSNDGYRLLGAIIEKVTGKNYDQALQENILMPLKMTKTGYSHQNIVLEKRAQGYRKRLSGLENAQYYQESPASGMYSTVEDLLLFDEAVYSDKLLSQKSKDLMLQIVPSGNAYGWHVSNKDGLLVIRNDGAVFGFFARVSRIPKNRYTIVLLTNVRSATNYLPEIEQSIINILYNKSYPSPKKSIAETLLTTFKQNGVESAVRQYNDLKNRQAKFYNFESESELNNLGYFLMNNLGKIKEAIEIFSLNVVAFPTSANAYDSLGEAYMRNGKKALAVKNFQKSVELNPQNTNALEMLKKLKEQ